MTAFLLRDARLFGHDDAVDVRIEGGQVTGLVPAGTTSDDGAEPVALDGRLLVPGLWDSHVHFTQWTIQRSRFDLSRTASAADVLDIVRDVLRDPARDRDAVATGYGFRDATWPDEPSLAALDAVADGAAVVLISGDLHCSWMSSPAAARLGIELGADGVVREGPWIAATPALKDAAPPSSTDYRQAALEAARRGVVGIVEFEHADNIGEWPERVAAGVDSLRVHASVWPDRLEAALTAGHRTGDLLEASGLVTVGPLKVVVDGSLNTRTALCWDPYPGLGPDHPHPCGVSSVPPDDLRALLRSAIPGGFAAAVHAIGDRANTEVLDVFAELGAPGTIEHAQLVSVDDFARFAALGLVASVQPEHAMDDRDVADRHWAGRTDRAFAYASLLDAGVPLRLGSDAPVAPLDPWISIAAATARTRDGREAWHPEQRIPLEAALTSSTRDGKLAVTTGDVADLAVLDADPFATTPEQLRKLPVAATMLGGRWTWRTL